MENFCKTTKNGRFFCVCRRVLASYDKKVKEAVKDLGEIFGGFLRKHWIFPKKLI